MQTPRPSDQKSIRDELAATIHENFNVCRGRNGVSPTALAQVILDSPAIRRIQADALRDAARDVHHEIRRGVVDPVKYLELGAVRIEKGDDK